MHDDGVTSGGALDLLRFMALSTSVHANAVRCAVDDTRSALIQMRTDEEELSFLEDALTEALSRQKRVHAMKHMVSLSRDERQKAGQLLSEAQSEEKARQRAHTMRHRGKQIISSSSISSNNARHKMPLAARAHGDAATDDSSRLPEEKKEGSSELPSLLSVDEEVEQLKEKLRTVDTMSVQTKLLRLKAALQKAAAVDGDALLASFVDPFTFSADVEALWGSSSHSSNSSSGVRTMDRQSSAEENVIDDDNIDGFISRACQRLAGRCEDALRALSATNFTDRKDAERIYGCMLYANALDSPDNYETAAVQSLQQYGGRSLKTHYDAQRRVATVDAPISAHCLMGNNKPNTVLSEHEFCALPTDWPATNALRSIPVDTLLPPARQVLVPRFSYASTEELQMLEQLRVDIQRHIVQGVLDMPAILNESWGTIDNEGAHVPPTGRRDRAVATARLAVNDTAGNQKSHTWITITQDSTV